MAFLEGVSAAASSALRFLVSVASPAFFSCARAVGWSLAGRRGLKPAAREPPRDQSSPSLPRLRNREPTGHAPSSLSSPSSPSSRPWLSSPPPPPPRPSSPPCAAFCAPPCSRPPAVGRGAETEGGAGGTRPHRWRQRDNAITLGARPHGSPWLRGHLGSPHLFVAPHGVRAQTPCRMDRCREAHGAENELGAGWRDRRARQARQKGVGGRAHRVCFRVSARRDRSAPQS